MMRSSLDHLPASKERELAHVVRVLFEEFEEAIRLGTQPWKRRGRIIAIILYGSYARGGWVDDPVGGYKSDFDILVVVNNAKLTDPIDYWAKADDRLMRDATITHSISAPVNFIVHDLGDVNDQLSQGRPFFVDIARQGVALYEADGFDLAEPRALPEEEAREEAKANFDRWFESAVGFREQAEHAVAKGRNLIAAFEYHQAAERFYHCVLLVLTLYSPKSHKLNFLRSQAEEVAPSLIEAWPRSDKASRRGFELLREAYVNARYSPHYSISEEELGWIGERITALQLIVRRVCEDRLRTPAP